MTRPLISRPLVRLAGIAHWVPSRVLRNEEFAAMGLDTNDEWIVKRTGVRERRIASATDTNCSMSTAAALLAMERAGISGTDLDLIVLGTASPDRLLPSTAVDVQAALGARRAAAFDVSAACSSWLYGLITAEALMATSGVENALVIGTEKLSAIVDWTDRSTCVLFGDGAGAAVLQRSTDQRGILSTFMRSDGALAELLYRPSGGANRPFDETVLQDRSHFVKMEGREVFKHAVRSMSEACDHAMAQAGLTGADIDLLIPHQANVRIIEATARHAGVSMDKVYVNVDRFGNTSSASIVIALDEAIRCGRVGPGATVMLVAFGAGFTWASLVIRL